MNVKISVEDLKELMVIAFVGLECMKDYCVDEDTVEISGYDAYRLSVIARSLRPFINAGNQEKMDAILGGLLSQPKDK